jgi:hypothetical protein
MKSNKKILVLALLLSMALAACGGGTDTDSVIATSVAQTQQISALETAAAGGSANQGDDNADAPADATELPTETPTITETATPDIPQLTLSQATNCREGPAVYYGYITTIQAGELMQVVGVHAQGNDYVIVDYGSGNSCWLWLQYADKTDFNGYGLTAYNTPPTPTPTFTPTPSFNWNGTWIISVEDEGDFPMPVTQTGDSISGSFDAGGQLVSITASLSADYQVATGTWSTDSNSGPFKWQIKSGNPNQFVGSGDPGKFWCGAKNGASQPSPCLWP